MKFSNLFTSDDSSEFVEVCLELEFELNAHRFEQQEADSIRGCQHRQLLRVQQLQQRAAQVVLDEGHEE